MNFRSIIAGLCCAWLSVAPAFADGYYSVGGLLTIPLPVSQGGTGLTSLTGLRASIGAAGAGSNSDITSLSGLTTPLSVPQGGLGLTSCTGLFVGAGTTGSCLQGGVSQPINGIYWFQNRVTTAITGNAVALTGASIFNTTSLNAHGGNYVGGAFSSTGNASDNGAFTTISVAAAIGDQSATVASSTGFLVGDFLSIALDNGNIFPAIVSGVSGNVVSFSGYSFPSVASIGNGFYDPKGHISALITNGIATAAGTGYLAVEGGEVGTSMRTGSSSFMKCGWCIINNFDDAVHGSNYDAGLLFSTQSGTPEPVYWNTLIDISKVAGYMPVGANSWIMRADGGATVTGFFDLSNLVCSGGYELNFRQFTVDCGGNANINQLVYNAGENDRSKEVFFPLTGTTVIPAVNDSTIVLIPAGTLAALTLQIGGCSAGVDGHITRISTTQAITSFSLTTLVGTIDAPMTTLTAHEGHAFICQGNTSKFYRLY